MQAVQPALVVLLCAGEAVECEAASGDVPWQPARILVAGEPVVRDFAHSNPRVLMLKTLLEQPWSVTLPVVLKHDSERRVESRVG